jgi:ribonuclease R
VKQVSFMANHLGEEYDGVISGVMSYGFFVRLNNLGSEGLVRFSTVDDDYYYFDEQNFRVIGRKKGMVYRLGDAIRVGILKVNVVRAEIDLFIPQTKTERKKKLTKPAPFRPGKRVLEKKSGRKKDRSRKRKRK